MPIASLLRNGQSASTARIRTSACRGYVVELDPEDGGPPQMLESSTGNVAHFRSLDRVRETLRRHGVRQATLVQYHACEEVGALGVSTREESGVSVL